MIGRHFSVLGSLADFHQSVKQRYLSLSSMETIFSEQNKSPGMYTPRLLIDSSK